MATYPKFPCCSCQYPSDVYHTEISNSPSFRNVCKVGEVQIKRILEKVLYPLILNTNKLLNDHFYEGAKPRTLLILYNHSNPVLMYNRESVMCDSIYWLLHLCLQRDESKVNVDNVQNLDDVSFCLNKELNNILETHMKCLQNAFEIIRGNGMYQKLVLNILFFTVKFMSECINKLKTEDNVKIFHQVIDVVDTFLLTKNISLWIKHSIQVMNPFGVFPADLKKKLAQNAKFTLHIY